MRKKEKFYLKKLLFTDDLLYEDCVYKMKFFPNIIKLGWCRHRAPLCMWQGTPSRVGPAE